MSHAAQKLEIWSAVYNLQGAQQVETVLGDPIVCASSNYTS